jgi:hypothetical protein
MLINMIISPINGALVNMTVKTKINSDLPRSKGFILY